jgi:RNA polymerase sigma-70 factor (ECF subfamily)
VPVETEQMTSDAELARRAASGDPAAFADVVRRHRGTIFHFARRLVRDPALAEDVLQETFLAAHASLSTFRGEGSMKSWLLAIARTRALTLLRKKSGEPADFESVETLEGLGAKAGWGRPLDPEVLAQRLEQVAVLEKALSTLPEGEREVVLLRDVEGLSGEETAAALGLTVAAVKSRLHRGRLQLLATVKAGGAS